MSHLQQTITAADAFENIAEAADEAIFDERLEALLLDPEAEARIVLAEL